MQLKKNKETIIIYGIPNCDTIKKTLGWFTKNKIEFEFHDYKKSGISKEKLNAWCKLAGWEIVLNKKSSTWRNLPKEEQEKITNQTKAIALMQHQNSIIKRPVIEIGDKILVGFDENIFIDTFK